MNNRKQFAVYPPKDGFAVANSLRFIVYSFLFALLSCNSGSDKPTFTDTTVSGEITIVCDESYEPFMSVESDTFHNIYQNAKVNIKYLPEAEAFKELVSNDSVRMIVSCRNLNESEKAYFSSRNLVPRTTKVAVDAVAFITNKDNQDSLLRFEQLKSILNGDINSWRNLNSKLKTQNSKPNSDSIVVVFDKSGSANARYLQELFLNKNPSPKHWFAANSNAEVVNYVNKNKNAIGVISVNWISDKDDPATNNFLDKVRVVSLSPPDSSTFATEFFKPYQAYIALKQYPLIRDVYMISREGRAGLGTGFASFVAGDQGQRIIRLMGMLPATMPIRLIQTR